VLAGAITGNWRWSSEEAAAVTVTPRIDITALMASVDVASLPMTEVADLF
jgi:hypothetical protein